MKNFNTFYRRKKTIKQTLLPGLLMVLFFVGVLPRAWGQADSPPGISATTNSCNRTFTVNHPVWYSNSGGEDTEIEELKVSVNDGNSTEIVWRGYFRGDSGGFGGEHIHGGWDDDQTFGEEYLNGWQYGGSYSLEATNPGGDSWITYESSFKTIPGSWYGKTITIRVFGSFDGDLNYDKSTTITLPDIPATSGLQATTSNNNFCDKIELTWTKPNFFCDSGFSYTIQKRTSGGNWSHLTTVSDQDDEAYIHSGLSPDDHYEYQIRTEYAGAHSSFSSTASGSTIALPEAPINFTASDDNCDQTVDLSWDFELGAGVSNPSNFRVYRNGELITSTVGGNNRSYKDEDVPNRGTTYTYKIQAKNVCGWSSDNVFAEDEGGSPSDPTPPVTVTTETVPGLGIQITWPPATLVTEYKIERNLLGGGGSTFLGPIDADETTYLDESVVACQTYEYRVIAINDCKADGVPTEVVSSARLVPDLSNTFNDKAIIASKGYHSNRVELTWTIANNLNFINAFKIYRRELGSPDSALIASLNSGSNIYVDNLADAGKLYEYSIIAETQCENETVYSNVAKTIGFRSPFGTVTGSVSYSGGTPVKDVKVTGETTAQIFGKSIEFDGNDYLDITHKDNLNAQGELLLETWLRPTAYSQNFGLIEKPGAYALKYSQSEHEYQFTVEYNGSQSSTIRLDAAELSLDNYHHLAAQLHEDSLKFYLNGEVKVSEYLGDINIDDNSNDIKIGDGYEGLLTELRIWTSGKSNDQIKRDYSRLMVGGEQGLSVYLRTNEGRGDYAYDASKSDGIFNRNHAAFVGDPTWSDVIPSNSQLGLIAYTNENGIYILIMPYNGNGETFTLTPTFPTHQFNPATKALFLGDGSSVHNNIDFEDKSSFVVSGTVFFDKKLHGDNSNCPSEGVKINVINKDEVVVVAGIEMTSSTGEFTVEVPIGDHYIKLEKENHVFSVGRFPVENTLNFQEPLAGLEFVDSTYRRVIGRVVGGLKEGNKKLGFGLLPEHRNNFNHSKNNIGKADITFKAQSGCKTLMVETDDETGEYEAWLPPLRYNIENIELENNFGNALFDQDNIANGIGSALNLTEVGEIKIVRDTFLGAADDPIVDSITYNAIYKVIHRNNPTITVKGDTITTTTGDSLFVGERKLDLGDGTIMDLVPIAPGNSPIPYPVFKQNVEYLARIFINEVYHKYDEDGNIIFTDNTPSIGKLTIVNGLDAQTYANNDVIIRDGQFDYAFRAGEPSRSLGAITKYNYTDPMEIIFESDGVETVSYTPFPLESNGDQLYRGYILGGTLTGTDVTVAGPASVDLILRDPPGSKSYATWAADSTYTTIQQTRESTNLDVNGSIFAQVGLEFAFGTGLAPGPEVKFDQHVRITDNFSHSRYKTEEDIEVNEFKTSESISTSSSSLPAFVGGQGDIMVGTSSYQSFGKGLFLTPVREDLCANPAVECFTDEISSGYRLGFKPGIVFLPDSGLTKYIFTVYEIENVVIPDLETIRNELFVAKPDYYVSHVTDETAPDFKRKFGSNNDDFNVWGDNVSTQEFFKAEDKDTTGMSYTFYRSKHQADFGNKIDSIRVVNNQIRLWKLALAENEKAKYEALTMPSDTIENITIGTAILEKSYSTTNEKTKTTTKETQFAAGTDVELQFLINGSGAGGNAGYTFTNIEGSTDNTSTVVTNTFSYHIEDGDLGDLINVSVINPKDGNSAIFRVNGGQTACPFMDAEVMHYYDKNNPGNPDELVFASTYISNPDNTYSPRTVQRDKPTLDVTQSILFNIPADEPAVFTLLLGNDSESEDDRLYDLRIDLGSNPSGAILEIDGLDPNREYLVPYSLGASTPLTKTLTLRRGPNTFDYENIKIILKSPCDKRIYDSIFISAHFIPTCTEPEVYSPGDNWVLNNSFDNKLPINIQGYNYNYAGFEEMKFQYKLASGSTWFDAARFLKDTMGLSNEPDLYFISNQTTFSTFDWDVSMLDDGLYEFRALSICNFPAYTNIRNESDPSYGIMDRINPHPFGNPSPADGILSPNDEISIKFNEPIDLGSLTLQNFDIRGVLNGTPTNHSTSLFFDGVDDYVEVTGGAALRNRDFTIAFAAKRAGTGEEAVISQGTDIKERLFIGFNANDQFVFRIGEEEVASTMSFADDEWRYYGVSYNQENETAELYVIDQSINEIVNVGNTSIFQDYRGSGKLLFGKNTVNNADHFEGKLHEISIWGTARSLAEFSVSSGRLLSAGELGLLYNWRMDEATGSLAVEHLRRRDGNIAGPIWSIEPSGDAASFDGADDYLKVAAGDVVVTPGMDFTLEFWFNSSQAGEATLFSNGTASNIESDSLFSWNIDKDAAGKIHVKNYGIDFVAVDSNFFDGSWHHFALVLQRTGSLSAYIDGNLQNSTQALPFKQFGGSHIYLGARGFTMGVAETVENHFAGQIDEFRFWNASRKVEQIRRDKQNRMKGDEGGLMLYFPFENYQVENGVPILTETFDEQIDPDNHTVENPNGATLIDQTPTIKLQRPVQAIAFTYSVNNDEIIFTPTTSQELIENVTLDVTVKDVKDLQGNVMESPKTWIAYVDKNQVFWQDDLLEFQKEVGEELSFTSAVVNEGGSNKTFEIKNVPEWLSVSPQMGTIAANSQKQIQFEIDPLTNIGDYIQDLQLLTDFNFPERLTIGLKVREKEPEWAVDPADFQNSMSIIGAIEIKGVISTDGEDKLAAFVDDEVRGINYLRYVPQIDRYLVFMDVYSNENFGEELTFKVWDASEGIIYSEVEPEFILFDANTLVGSTTAPQIFSTSFEISVDIEVKQGWNWISNFLFSTDSTNLDLTLESLDAQTGDEIKGLTDFSNYSQGNGWRGTLNNVGIRPESLYKLHVAKDGILKWKGDVLDPTSREISLVNNWNWIGFISIRNQSVAQALGQLTPTEGDLIKGRSQFAVYDEQLGWIGSLETLVPGSGYMYKSIGEKSFRYPLAGMFRNDPETPEDLMLEQWPIDYGAYASNMTAIAQFSRDCDFPMDSDDFAIGVFDPAGNCRGVSLLHPRNEDQLHFLTITGTGAENLNVQLLNVTTAKAYPIEQGVAYASNSHQGEVSAPLLLSLSEEVCRNVQMEVDPPSDLFSVYPSVFRQDLTLEFTAKVSDENARVKLYNIWGQLVYETNLALEEGYNRHSISLNGQALQAGTYLVVLQTNGTRKQQKVIKQ